MKLKKTFISHQSGDKTILVDVTNTFVGMVRSNATAAFIVDCLKNETTEAAIVEAMLTKYDAPKEVIANDVADIIAKLRQIGAIEEN